MKYSCSKSQVSDSPQTQLTVPVHKRMTTKEVPCTGRPPHKLEWPPHTFSAKQAGCLQIKQRNVFENDTDKKNKGKKTKQDSNLIAAPENSRDESKERGKLLGSRERNSSLTHSLLTIQQPRAIPCSTLRVRLASPYTTWVVSLETLFSILKTPSFLTAWIITSCSLKHQSNKLK